jgi:hypothetical protein
MRSWALETGSTACTSPEPMKAELDKAYRKAGIDNYMLRIHGNA